MTCGPTAYPELSEGRPGLLGAVTSRAEAHTMRLAMLYALIDRSPVIRADHLRSGLALWRFAERSAAFIFGDALGDPDADALLEALRAAMPEGLTRTEIREGVFQRHKSSEQIARTLRMLSAADLAHARTEATGGRPAERWFAGRAPRHKCHKRGISMPSEGTYRAYGAYGAPRGIEMPGGPGPSDRPARAAILRI